MWHGFPLWAARSGRKRCAAFTDGRTSRQRMRCSARAGGLQPYVQARGTQMPYMSHLFLYLSCMKAEGLTMKNGRLINNRPDGMTGIAEASRLRQSVRRAEKISMIADGISLAEMRENMMRSF